MTAIQKEYNASILRLSKNYEFELRQKSAEIKEQQAEQEKLREEIKILNEEIVEVKKFQKIYEDNYKGSIDAHNEEMQIRLRLESKLNSINNFAFQLEKENRKFEADRLSVERRKNFLENEYINLNLEVNTLNQKIKGLEVSTNEYKNIIFKLENELKKSKDELQIMDGLYSVKKKEAEESARKIEELKAVYDISKFNLKESGSELSQIQSQIKIIKEENIKLKSNNEEEISKILNMQQGINKDKVLISELEIKIQSLEKLNKEYLEGFNNYKLLLEVAQNEQKSLKLDLNEIILKNKAALTDNSILQQEINNLKKVFEELTLIRRNLESQLEISQKENIKEKFRNEETNKEFEKFKEEYFEIEKENTNLRQEKKMFDTQINAFKENEVNIVALYLQKVKDITNLFENENKKAKEWEKKYTNEYEQNVILKEAKFALQTQLSSIVNNPSLLANENILKNLHSIISTSPEAK